jgi:protein-S-isoprenylcysteine O-methyltransferase Ste14
MNVRRWLRSFVVLPGIALLLIPVLIVWFSRGSQMAFSWAMPDQAGFWLGLLAGVLGAWLSLASVSNMLRYGDGTPAPWEPTRRLVLRGPYRYVRNPMMIGVMLILLAEALLLRSWGIAIWLAIFWLLNGFYLPRVEEKGLEQRFGEDYRQYKANVPRWIPRTNPWEGPGGG